LTRQEGSPKHPSHKSMMNVLMLSVSLHPSIITDNCLRLSMPQARRQAEFRRNRTNFFESHCPNVQPGRDICRFNLLGDRPAFVEWRLRGASQKVLTLFFQSNSVDSDVRLEAVGPRFLQKIGAGRSRIHDRGPLVGPSRGALRRSVPPACGAPSSDSIDWREFDRKRWGEGSRRLLGVVSRFQRALGDTRRRGR
jgi:hypothetical protein